MTDREVLLLAYGALKATKTASKEVIVILETHLFPVLPVNEDEHE